MTKITKPILIGILLSALLFPTATVQAQFTVYDPVANINSLNQLQQWITAITKYETMITKQIEQVTNLRTIMQHGEKMLGQFKISEWGKLIRMGFKLKWQIESLISAQGRIFMGIQRRALNGILNPQQDLEEFERYLVYSIGRTAEAEKYKLDQAIRGDRELKQAPACGPPQLRAQSDAARIQQLVRVEGFADAGHDRPVAATVAEDGCVLADTFGAAD